MRMWHYKLLPYLPDRQLRGQLRELVAILHNWKNKGTPNHLLVNPVLDYPVYEFYRYFIYYSDAYNNRFKKPISSSIKEEFYNFLIDNFNDYDKEDEPENIYVLWHNDEYLKCCLINLYEKYKFGVGKSKLTDDEWFCLEDGYRFITGKDFKL